MIFGIVTSVPIICSPKQTAVVFAAFFYVLFPELQKPSSPGLETRALLGVVAFVTVISSSEQVTSGVAPFFCHASFLRCGNHVKRDSSPGYTFRCFGLCCRTPCWNEHPQCCRTLPLLSQRSRSSAQYHNIHSRFRQWTAWTPLTWLHWLRLFVYIPELSKLRCWWTFRRYCIDSFRRPTSWIHLQRRHTILLLDLVIEG